MKRHTPTTPPISSASLSNDSLQRIQDLATEGAACLDRYQHELETSQLPVVIEQAKSEFDASISGANQRGFKYGFGGMRPEVSLRLYGLIRHLRPQVLVETGVCNGVSSAVILAALARNGMGMMHSIDLPEHTDTVYPDGTFWQGKLGAAIPKDKQPGWLIPDELKTLWTLTIGRSQEQLPVLLERLGTIDFFLHDSEHSYECMMFEYQTAWKHLKTGGVLTSDDIGWNTAFKDFAQQQAREVQPLALNMAFIIK